MKHAIEDLKKYMFNTISLTKSKISDDEDKKMLIAEITSYVNAINELELFYEGEKVTDLELILYNNDLDLS